LRPIIKSYHTRSTKQLIALVSKQPKTPRRSVDLAGNERLNEVITYMSESNSINKSLFFLGQVISKLSQKEEHIPYRNSKLTSILSMHLGQNANTALLVALHPLEEFIDESLTTLRFAQKASTIKCEVRRVFQSKEHRMILTQRDIIADLRQRLHEFESASKEEPHVFRSSSKELDSIVTTLHQNQQVLEKEKQGLKDALRQVGRQMDQVARKAQEVVGAPATEGPSLSRLEKCIDLVEKDKAQMREMEKRLMQLETEKAERENRESTVPTREPSPECDDDAEKLSVEKKCEKAISGS